MYGRLCTIFFKSYILKVHRIGRTGRAGAKGVALSFISPDDDFKIASDLIDFLNESEQVIP